MSLQSRGRGRPKRDREENKDAGTPEFQAKRASGITQELVDWCFERAMLSPEQHRAALHLRWLYTLRFGAPGMVAVNITGEAMRVNMMEEEKRLECEAACQHALKLLHQKGFEREILSFCIYNERSSLFHGHHLQPLRMARLQEGLDLLVKAWDWTG